MKRRLSEGEVRSLYDRMAFTYDFWGKLTDSRAHRLALSLADIRDGERILEVGVGTALLFRRVVTANASGLNAGLDISFEMLSVASRKLPSSPGHVLLSAGSAFHLPYPDASFDLLMATYVLDIIDDDSHLSALREWNRVVKPRGRLVLADMTHGSHWYNHFWGFLYRVHPKLMGGCRPIHVATRLPQTGWVPLERRLISQLTFPSEVIVARKDGPHSSSDALIS